MPKKLVNFRLSDAALADLTFCLAAAKRRMDQYGYQAPSQSEVVEQALSKLAHYYRGLKLGQGEKGKVDRKK